MQIIVNLENTFNKDEMNYFSFIFKKIRREYTSSTHYSNEFAFNFCDEFLPLFTLIKYIV